MACGTPAVVSNTSALPEISADAAVLVNPENPDDIAWALLKLEQDKDFMEDKIKAGLERAKSFSWKISAGKVLNIYNSFETPIEKQ